MQESAGKAKNMEEYEGRNIQEYNGICRNMRIYKNMSAYVGRQEYARICRNILKYAGICGNMQERVGICGPARI